MRASLARTLATPAIARALEKTHAAASTAKSCASLTWFDRDSSTWKTSQRSLETDWESFSETWPRAGMTVDGHAFELPTLERRTSGIDGGALLATPTRAANQLSPSMLKHPGCRLWQTPVADDAVNRTAGKFNSRGEPKLSAQVMWPTPSATLGTHAGLVTPSKAREGGTLVEALSARTTWPTPNASDANKWSHQSLAERQAKGQQVCLNTAVSPQGGLGGSLNPPWVEWLMGWPLAWTVSRHWATAKSRSKRRSAGLPAEGR
jgi:hypothetical protein